MHCRSGASWWRVSPTLSCRNRAASGRTSRPVSLIRADRCRVLEPDAAGPADGAPLAAAQGLDVLIEAGIAEFDQNSPEYIPVEELKAANDPRWIAMVDGTWDSDETDAEFRARTIGADRVDHRTASRRSGSIAACHGGVINLYLGHVLGPQRIDAGVLLSQLHLDPSGRRRIERRTIDRHRSTRPATCVAPGSPWASSRRADHDDASAATDSPLGDLIAFLDGSPSPWHAVESTIDRLTGFEPPRRGRRLDRRTGGRLRRP